MDRSLMKLQQLFQSLRFEAIMETWVLPFKGVLASRVVALFLIAMVAIEFGAQAQENSLEPDLESDLLLDSQLEEAVSKVESELKSSALDYSSLLEMLTDDERLIVERRVAAFGLFDWTHHQRESDFSEISSMSENDQRAWSQLPDALLAIISDSDEDRTLRSIALDMIFLLPDQIKSSDLGRALETEAGVIQSQLESGSSFETADRLWFTNVLGSWRNWIAQASNESLPLVEVWETLALSDNSIEDWKQLAFEVLASKSWISLGNVQKWLMLANAQAEPATRRVQAALYWSRSVNDSGLLEKQWLSWALEVTTPDELQHFAEVQLQEQGWQLPETGRRLMTAWLDSQTNEDRRPWLRSVLETGDPLLLLSAIQKDLADLLSDPSQPVEVRVLIARLLGRTKVPQLDRWISLAFHPETHPQVRDQLFLNLLNWINQSGTDRLFSQASELGSDKELQIQLWEKWLEVAATKVQTPGLQNGLKLWFMGLKSDLQSAGDLSLDEIHSLISYWDKAWNAVVESSIQNESFAAWVPDSIQKLRSNATSRYWDRFTHWLSRWFVLVLPILILVGLLLGFIAIRTWAFGKKPLIFWRSRALEPDKSALHSSPWNWVARVPISESKIFSEHLFKSWKQELEQSKSEDFKFIEEQEVDQAPAKVMLGAQVVQYSPALIRSLIRRQDEKFTCEIHGESRSGKSALLMQTLQWVMTNEGNLNSTIPVVVKLDGRETNQQWEQNFTTTVLKQLRAQYLSEWACIQPEWALELASRGWIWVFVDHPEEGHDLDLASWIKEWNSQGWKNIIIARDSCSAAPHIDGSIVVATRELERDQVGAVWEKELRNSGQEALLDRDIYFDALKSFTGLMETGSSPLETVLIGLEWVLVHAVRQEDTPARFPDSILSLYLWWGSRRNEEIKKKRLADSALERLAQAVAWESLRSNRKLEPVKKVTIYSSLSDESQISLKLEYLERKLRWLEPADEEGRSISWCHKNFAYYLASGKAIDLFREDLSAWQTFLDQWPVPSGEMAEAERESYSFARALYLTVVQHPVSRGTVLRIPEQAELQLARLAGVNDDQATRTLRKRRLNDLLDQLLDLETNDRTSILQTLGEMGMDARSAATPLVGFALDQKQDLELRQAALEGLSALGPAAGGSAEELVQAALNPDEHLFFRLKMVEAIGNIGEKAFKTVSSLIRLLNQESTQPFFKYQILEALGKIGPAAHESMSVIQRYVRSESKDLKEAAEWAIASIHGKNPPPLRVRNQDNEPGFEAKLSSLAALDSMGRWIHLARSLRDPETVDREHILKSLQEGGNEARMAVSELVKIMKDKEADMEARQLALDAVAVLGNRALDAASALVKLAMDPDELIFYRIKAIETLQQIGEEAVDAAEALRSVCVNPREQVFFRSRIIGSLAEMGEDGKRLALSWRNEMSPEDLAAGLEESFKSIKS